MDSTASEHPGSTLYASDCKEAIRRVDAHIFEGVAKSPAQVFIFPDFPESGISGEHVGRMLSLLHNYPDKSLFPLESVARLESKQECYVIWEHQLTRKVEQLLRNPNNSGLGDSALRELWFLLAVGLVRRRVLYRTKWFPNAKLRDVRSIRKHAHLLGNDVFLELRRLELKHEANDDRPALLDIHLTQEIVGAALNAGMSESDALAYITSD